MQLRTIFSYAACFAAVAHALPASDPVALLLRTPEETDLIDLNLDEKEGLEGLGLENTNLAPLMREGESRWSFGLRWVEYVIAAPALGYALYGLAGDCKEYDENGEPIDGNKCVGNAIFTAVATVMCARAYKEIVVEITTTLHTYAMERSGQMLGEVWQNFNALGPFVRPQDGPIPMPEIATLKARGEDIMKRADETMSARMGLEVRHIGIWDGLMPGEMRKRGEEEKFHPVFAFSRNNVDFHAAYLGEHAPGEGDRFKLGMGPGTRTEMNVKRLKARQFDEEDGQYNAQYFDRGGLDVFGVTSFAEGDDGYEELDAQEDLQWLHDEVTCTVDAEGPGSDYFGLWWGVLDYEQTTTHSGGGLAAFSPETPSIISYMKLEGHMSPREDCTVPDSFYGP